MAPPPLLTPLWAPQAFPRRVTSLLFNNPSSLQHTFPLPLYRIMLTHKWNIIEIPNDSWNSANINYLRLERKRERERVKTHTHTRSIVEFSLPHKYETEFIKEEHRNGLYSGHVVVPPNGNPTRPLSDFADTPQGTRSENTKITLHCPGAAQIKINGKYCTAHWFVPGDLRKVFCPNGFPAIMTHK